MPICPTQVALGSNASYPYGHEPQTSTDNGHPFNHGKTLAPLAIPLHCKVVFLLTISSYWLAWYNNYSRWLNINNINQ